jgi:hypothetical protein
VEIWDGFGKGNFTCVRQNIEQFSVERKRQREEERKKIAKEEKEEILTIVAVTKLHASRPRKDVTLPLLRGSKSPVQRY